MENCLFCDEHEAAPEVVDKFTLEHSNCVCGGKPYRDLSGSGWTRRALALLKGSNAEISKVQVDVDGIVDPNHNIKYIGKATKMEDGTWRCLANVEGMLCVVEVFIKPKSDHQRPSVFSCSFCGKTYDECDVLVTGPMVNICNDCIQVAQDCVDDILGNNKNNTVEFVRRMPTDTVCDIEAICETCLHCVPAPSPLGSEDPWWMGVCNEGFKLDIKKQSCSKHWLNPGKPEPAGCRCKDRAHALGISYEDSTQIAGECSVFFTPPPGEFSGCRCPNCPEKAGVGECKCCAERRAEDKNPNPEPFV